MNKYDFFMLNRDAAIEGTNGIPAFVGATTLLTELRTVFDWIAQEPRAQRIPCRVFRQRLPEIHRIFPQVASSFARMDANGDGWLTWSEFVTFCLRDERLPKILQRSSCLTVYGRADGSRTYKDALDPARTCELCGPPPILPWETSHVVEWRIEGLQLSCKGSPVAYRGMPLRPGGSIASPPFQAAGVSGFLRFWPMGYWTGTQRQRKSAIPPGTEALVAGAPSQLPSTSSWCCLGVCLPPGTHLVVRFDVHGLKSPAKECYWEVGTSAAQLWAPPESEAPADLVAAIGPVVVGIEILRNLAADHCVPRPERVGPSARRARRPPVSDAGGVVGSVLLGRAESLPKL